MTRHIPPGQLGRYLLVGIWNVGFGYGAFAYFTAVLNRYIPYSYLAAILLASLVNITVAFLGYKWFVFRTRGNYLKEWLRTLTMYSGTVLLGLVSLPVLVWLVKVVTGRPALAPYIAGAILTGLNLVISFLGHKHFSFRNTKT